MTYRWKHLTTAQVGKYAEYFAKMEFTRAGLDVYTAEVDDKGIDFLVRLDESRCLDVQVKAVRGRKGYVYLRKEVFRPRWNLFLVLAILDEGEPPELFLIPSLISGGANPLLVSRDFEGKKSKPEWGLDLTCKVRASLETHRFSDTIDSLREVRDARSR